MTGPHFKILIARDGTVRIEAEGFAGPACLTRLDEAFAGLGTELAREAKPEFYLLPQESTPWQTTKD